MELARHIGSKRSVYGLDDGCLLSANNFNFQSIADVAHNCFECLKAALANFATPAGVKGDEFRIILAGWSYGGVVAAELGILLTKLPMFVGPEGFRVVVDSLYLFDSPLRDAVVPHAQPPKTSDKELAARSDKHFEDCTALLEKYYERGVPSEADKLTCPVIDIRPQAEVVSAEMIQSVKELTTGPVNSYSVPGTHWTIVFGENANTIANIILGK
jgi:pimeloyl-ACP methyl ester carboxylesterase